MLVSLRIPLLTSANWTKFWSLKSVLSFLAKNAVISSLSAPGTVKLVKFLALSFSDGSTSEEIRLSVTFKPTL